MPRKHFQRRDRLRRIISYRRRYLEFSCGRVDAGRRVRHPHGMSIIAQELDERLRTLDPRRAARCEQLVRDVLALLDEEPKPASQPRREFITRTHDSGLMPGIDPTKLGQMVEEL